MGLLVSEMNGPGPGPELDVMVDKQSLVNSRDTSSDPALMNAASYTKVDTDGQDCCVAFVAVSGSECCANLGQIKRRWARFVLFALYRIPIPASLSILASFLQHVDCGQKRANMPPPCCPGSLCCSLIRPTRCHPSSEAPICVLGTKHHKKANINIFVNRFSF